MFGVGTLVPNWHVQTVGGAALFSSFSIRANLAILIAAVMTLLVADRVREIVQIRNEAIEGAKVEILELAERGARRQADVVTQAEAVLRLAAGLPEISARSVTGCQVPFRRMLAVMPWLMDVSVVDAYGKLVCTTALQRPTKGVGDRQYFRDVFVTRNFVLSDYIVSRLTQKPVLVAAMPQMAGGLIEGVLLASIDVHAFSAFADLDKAAPATDLMLLDSTGTVVATSPPLQHWAGKNIADRAKFWSALRSPNGVFEAGDLDGEDRIVGHARLPATDATLVVVRNRGAVLQAANQAAAIALAKIALLGSLCLVVIWLGGRRLVLRPICDLTRSAELFGAGQLGARVNTRDFSPELRLLGDTFNDMAAQIAKQKDELHRANKQLEELATTDSLTGLANRRRFDAQIESEWQRAIRNGDAVSVLLVDVDNFKKYNDRYGHIQGDDCLRNVARVLQSATRRPGDLAGRTGGEEFALLLPGAELSDAARIAEDIRTSLAAMRMEHLDNAPGYVTVSIGAAAVRPNRNSSVRAILDAADAALYRAKRGGRNRIETDAAPIALAS